MNHQHHTTNITFKEYIPLLLVYLFILLASIVISFIQSFSLMILMRNFMAIFFITFGVFKLIDLKGFVEGYRSYDLLAKRFKFYAWIYPFIELFLGIAFLINFHITIISSITLVLSVVNCLGIFIELKKGNKVHCSCLGTIIKVPLTNVSLIEYLLMGVMAAIMIFIRI